MRRSLGILVLVCAMMDVVVGQDFGLPRNPTPAVPKAVDPTFGDAFIGSSVGIAMPMGDLASKDYRNYFSGYANNGYVINFINFHQKFNNNFGLGVNWSRSQFSSEFGLLADGYNNQFRDIDFSAEASSDWVLHGALANFVVNVPHKLIDIDVRVSAGLGRAVRPEIILEGYEKTTGFFVYSWQQKETIVNDFMWGFGVKARLHVTKSFDVFLQSDFQRMKSTFEIENVYALSFSDFEEITQNFETLSLAVGVGFVLD